MVADLPAWLLRDSWETCNSTQEFSPDSRGKIRSYLAQPASARCFRLFSNHRLARYGTFIFICFHLCSNHFQRYRTGLNRYHPYSPRNDAFFEASARRTSEIPIWLREIDAPGANTAPTRDHCTHLDWSHWSTGASQHGSDAKLWGWVSCNSENATKDGRWYHQSFIIVIYIINRNYRLSMLQCAKKLRRIREPSFTRFKRLPGLVPIRSSEPASTAFQVSGIPEDEYASLSTEELQARGKWNPWWFQFYPICFRLNVKDIMQLFMTRFQTFWII